MGSRAFAIRDTLTAGAMSERYTLTLVTSISSNSTPVSGCLKDGSNDSGMFFNTCLELIKDGFLAAGDILVLDNAKVGGSSGTQSRGAIIVSVVAQVHTHAEMLALLLDILDHYGISMMFLPCYSPEFNPAELVFAMIKSRLRNRRWTNTLWAEISLALASISREEMMRFYVKALLEDIS